MTLRVAAATHIGRIRTRNEDCFGWTGGTIIQDDDRAIEEMTTEEPLVAVVADGLGGHPCGDVASHLVVKEVVRRMPTDAESLVAAIKSADAVLTTHGADAGECEGLAATVAAVLVTRNDFIVANVGDSRVYVLEDDIPLTVLSTDDVLSSESVIGLGTGAVTRTLGGPRRGRSLSVHLLEVKWKLRTRILICSDGLSGCVPNADIGAILRKEQGLIAVNALVAAALAAGGRDNVTVLLAELM
jgi:serine/threonine protein phosphatase PrpC